MATNLSDRAAQLAAAIDRHGANLSAWKDQSLANETRAAALADRRLRAYLEDGVALEDGLRAARDAIDAEIEFYEATARVAAAVLSRRPIRRRGARWLAAAAAIVVAAGLGSFVDLKVVVPSEQAQFDVVVLDPLVFGPTEIERRMTEVDRSRMRRRWMAIGLVASLTLNAFFVGAAATDFLRDGGGRDHSGPRVLQFELHWLAGRLPSEAMKQIDAAVAGARPAAEGHIDKVKELRRQLGRLAAAPQPDRSAIDATLAAMRGEVDQMLAEVQKTTMDALIGLPPDVRAKLAEDSRDAKPQLN